MIVGGEDVNLCLRPFLYPSPGRGLISQHRLYEAQRDGGGSYPQPALTLGWGYSQQRSCGADTTPIGGFGGFGRFRGFRGFGFLRGRGAIWGFCIFLVILCVTDANVQLILHEKAFLLINIGASLPYCRCTDRGYFPTR